MRAKYPKYPHVLFSTGTVRERVGNGRQYIIEWADQSVQLQVQTMTRLLYCYAQEASLSQGSQTARKTGVGRSDHELTAFSAWSACLRWLPRVFANTLPIERELEKET